MEAYNSKRNRDSVSKKLASMNPQQDGDLNNNGGSNSMNDDRHHGLHSQE